MACVLARGLADGARAPGCASLPADRSADALTDCVVATPLSIRSAMRRTMILTALLLATPAFGWAQPASPEPMTLESLNFIINNLWILLATALVFVMHLGFSCIESGLERAKNTTNILFKNLAIVAIGLLSYAAVGFALMYPGDAWKLGHVVGFSGFGLHPTAADQTLAYGNFTFYTDFIFQGMFAATAATIVSGAVAGRVKLWPFLGFSAVFVALVYPLAGSWLWGGGWLSDLGFHDFAGSTLVHVLGGFGALAGAQVVGARTGKYVGGRIRPIVGHSLPLATVGMFLLWFGWFGFNGGSVLSADPNLLSLVFVTTSLAGAAGIVTSAITSQVVSGYPDLTMSLNGALGGLVAITAGADVIDPARAIFVGAVAGVIVVLAVIGFDKLRVDDPVGATSVHLVCGIWGTLAVGIFGDGEYSILTQSIGVVAVGAYAYGSAYLLLSGLHRLVGLRVSVEEEYAGLDISEHRQEAWGGFQVFTTD